MPGPAAATQARKLPLQRIVARVLIANAYLFTLRCGCVVRLPRRIRYTHRGALRHACASTLPIFQVKPGPGPT